MSNAKGASSLGCSFGKYAQGYSKAGPQQVYLQLLHESSFNGTDFPQVKTLDTVRWLDQTDMSEKEYFLPTAPSAPSAVQFALIITTHKETCWIREKLGYCSGLCGLRASTERGLAKTHWARMNHASQVRVHLPGSQAKNLWRTC